MFFSLAMLYADSGRGMRSLTASIASRAPERGHAPAGQRKALKRAVEVENAAPSPDSIEGHWRYVSSKERRVETPVAARGTIASGIVPSQKVSTNLLLSVLNL